MSVASPANAGQQLVITTMSSQSAALTAENLSTLLRIELVIERIVDAIAREDSELYIELKHRPSATNNTAERRINYWKIRFPGRTPKEAWRFSTLYSHELSAID